MTLALQAAARASVASLRSARSAAADPGGATGTSRRQRLVRASAFRARRNSGLGALTVTLGVAIIAAPWAVALAVWWRAGAWPPGTWVSPVSYWAVPAGVTVIALGRRMRAHDARDTLAGQDRLPVLYLRPFSADRAPVAVRWSSRLRIAPRGRFELTYEERLARSLRHVGPLVAVGDPTERLPLLGARRAYAGDEDWQQTVQELIGRCGLVLLHVGDTGGFAWEVEQIVARGEPELTVLALPVHAPRKRPSRQERYAAFRDALGGAFPQPLPESIGHHQFLFFDATWTPRLLGRGGFPPPNGEGVAAQALRRFDREFKITPLPLWARFALYVSGGLAVLVAGTQLASAR